MSESESIVERIIKELPGYEEIEDIKPKNLYESLLESCCVMGYRNDDEIVEFEVADLEFKIVLSDIEQLAEEVVRPLLDIVKVFPWCHIEVVRWVGSLVHCGDIEVNGLKLTIEDECENEIIYLENVEEGKTIVDRTNAPMSDGW